MTCRQLRCCRGSRPEPSTELLELSSESSVCAQGTRIRLTSLRSFARPACPRLLGLSRSQRCFCTGDVFASAPKGTGRSNPELHRRLVPRAG